MVCVAVVCVAFYVLLEAEKFVLLQEVRYTSLKADGSTLLGVPAGKE